MTGHHLLFGEQHWRKAQWLVPCAPMQVLEILVVWNKGPVRSLTPLCAWPDALAASRSS